MHSLCNGDLTKSDYFWNMHWQTFQNNYILFTEKRKEQIKELERSKTNDELIVKLLQFLHFK